MRICFTKEYIVLRQALLLYMVMLLNFHTDANAENSTDTIKNICKVQREYLAISGYFNYSSLDELFADNVYSGGNSFYGIAFESRKKILFNTSAKFSLFNRKPESIDVDPDLFPAESRFNTIRHLHFEIDNVFMFELLKNSFYNFKIYISGSWFTSGDYVINDFFDPELLLSTIAPGLYSEYCIKNLLFYANISSSLVSYTCRNSYGFARTSDEEEYSGIDFFKDNSLVLFPDNLVTCFTKIGCKMCFGNKYGMRMEYNFRFLNDSKPRVLKSITSIYSIGVFYRIVKK